MTKQILHPGEILYNECMAPLNMVIRELSTDIDISMETLNDVIMNKSPILEELDIALHHYFGTKKGHWLKLQEEYDETN